jgi:hypothetical protein
MEPNLERCAAIQEGEEIQSIGSWNRLEWLHLRALSPCHSRLPRAIRRGAEQVGQPEALLDNPGPIHSGL